MYTKMWIHYSSHYSLLRRLGSYKVCCVLLCCKILHCSYRVIVKFFGIKFSRILLSFLSAYEPLGVVFKVYYLQHLVFTYNIRTSTCFLSAIMHASQKSYCNHISKFKASLAVGLFTIIWQRLQ